MKKIACVVIALLLGVILSASVVFAGTMYAPKIKNRMVAQQKRIHKGVVSGCLTRTEARKLRYRLNCIRATESRLKADGYLTKRERARLHRQLNHNSKEIYFKKHSAVWGLYY